MFGFLSNDNTETVTVKVSKQAADQIRDIADLDKEAIDKIKRGIKAADEGNFASDEEVEAAFNRF